MRCREPRWLRAWRRLLHAELSGTAAMSSPGHPAAARLTARPCLFAACLREEGSPGRSAAQTRRAHGRAVHPLARRWSNGDGELTAVAGTETDGVDGRRRVRYARVMVWKHATSRPSGTAQPHQRLQRRRRRPVVNRRPDYVRTSCSRLHTGTGTGFGLLTWRRAAHSDRFGARCTLPTAQSTRSIEQDELGT